LRQRHTVQYVGGPNGEKFDSDAIVKWCAENVKWYVSAGSQQNDRAGCPPTWTSSTASATPQRIHEAAIMKAFIAACVAIGILWGIDVEFNNGRYSDIVQRAVKSVLPR
jgi:hypothetical protein